MTVGRRGSATGSISLQLKDPIDCAAGDFELFIFSSEDSLGGSAKMS